MPSIRTLILAGLVLTGATYAQDLPGMAVGVLEQSKLARQAVAGQDKAGALDHLKRARILMETIQRESADAPRPVLITVSREAESTTTYGPVKRSKSGEMSAERMKSNTNIREVEGSVRSTKLDVASAAGQLQNAQAAVERGDWSDADRALAAIAEGLVHTDTQGDMPLERARQNLRLARERVTAGKYKDAEMPIRSAAQALADYGKSGAHAAEAETLRQQMEEYGKSVAHEHADAAERIDRWSAMVSSWDASARQ